MFSNEDYLLKLLVESGMIDDEMIDNARHSLGDASITEKLIQKGLINQEEVAGVLASSNALDYLDLANTRIEPDVVSAVTDDIARRYKAIPVYDDGNTLTLAIADPFDFETLDSLPHVLGREVNFVVSTPDSIQQILKSLYGAAEFSVAANETIETNEGDAPIIKLVIKMLVDAFNFRASDIHIEPLETSVRIRYRVDGKLIEVANHPKKLLPAIIARLKVMSSSMSIAEKRLPQDGRIQIKVAGKDVDLRVSSVPSNHGESIVMRIFSRCRHRSRRIQELRRQYRMLIFFT